VCVESRCSLDAQPLHYGEAGPVRQRKILVWKQLPNRPCNFQIRSVDSNDCSNPAPQPIPEALCCPPTQTMVQQQPGLQEDVIRGYQRLARGEDLPGPIIPAVAGICGGVPDGSVNKQAHPV
jgi:hypothetical protein